MNEYITIPLSKTGKYAGKYEAMVSPEDADLAERHWNVSLSEHTSYAYCWGDWDGKKTKSMHHIIMVRQLGHPIDSTMRVDHIDRNGLNNTRENLRLATPTQNNGNRRNHGAMSKGVYWNKQKQKFMARITYNRKTIFLGYFSSEERAHEAYCKKAVELFGEYASFE